MYLVVSAVASIKFKVSKLHHDGESRTATYAGEAKLDGLDGVFALWISARHYGILKDTEVIIQIGKMTTSGTCVFDDPKSDVSIVASEDLGFLSSSVGRIRFTSDFAQGSLVGVLGFPVNSDNNLVTPTLTTGYVASTTAGLRSGLPAEAVEWRSHRFFMVDKNIDFGVFGGPVFDAYGGVLGMLCASCTYYTHASWVLKSSYMSDALDAVVESWVTLV